ncbi:MAG: hypothetical protein RL179_2280 [Planctomycetota bacterium]|jgi:uncharacterized repeat protein (TIGR03806 family)
MRRKLFGLVLIATSLFLASLSIGKAELKKEPVRKEFGIEKRTPWTTSKVIGSPEPPAPYKTELAFPKLQKFEEPLDLAQAPGTDRLFVAGRWGKIWSFVNSKESDKADLALEFKGALDSKGMPMKQIIYAITFHPKFKENGYMYVTWIPNPEKEGLEKGSRVSRYTVKGEPPVADPASEKIIFEWPNGGHNGGCLKFGHDGFLYIVTGDGSGIADQLDIGQDLSSVFAKLLRIDVDNLDEGRNYGIPRDNPFVNTKGARPEIYAYGLRQFWRFSFDRNKKMGLWGGEIGQDLWESVYNIQAGGNYGWSVMEGNHPFRPERKKGPTPILKPVVEHSHTDFRSITGGFIYHGQRLKELDGHYIYGDFDTGRIWTFKPTIDPVNQVQSDSLRELARTTYRIVSWGEDSKGEIYFVDFTGGGIHQLVKSEKMDDSAKNFPRKLSQTGVFSSTKDHIVAPGVIPYSVNAQLWGDHAEKDRFLAIPGDGRINLDEVTYPASPGAPPGWKFPDGTVIVKTFSMDMVRGNPDSRKRLETRIMHFQQFPGTQEYGDQYWRGYTYVWNDEQTDADLLDEKGADKLLKIKVGDKFVEQNYRFPSRAECTLCHNNAAKFALGVSTLQMNRDHDYNGVIANQLATLEHIGMFANKLPSEPAKMPKLPDYRDEKVSIEDRARSYLHSNCSHCHIKWGGGNAEFKLHLGLDLKDLGIVNVAPVHGSFNIEGAKLLVPGQPEKSIILERMKMTKLGRMPHIGSRVVDDQSVQLVHDWIKGLK